MTNGTQKFKQDLDILKAMIDKFTCEPGRSSK